MSKVLIENSTLINIAEAIRNKSENNSQMLPSEMPEHILNIDTEKVTIDDSKVTEKMNLYGFRNQVILDVNAPPSEPSGYGYQGALYDGSKLYMKTTLTIIKDGSTNSSAGCTGTVLLIKPNGTQLSVAIPTYTIPTERSETGTDPDTYQYSCYLYPSPDGNIYLRLQRRFTDWRSSSSIDHETYYQSIYKLNIYSSSLTWTTKAIEIKLESVKNIVRSDDFVIENNYIYAGSGGNTRYIYGYKFGDTSYTFQRISTNSIYYSSYGGGDPTIFARKGTNTYIYFWTNNHNTVADKWISITRNSDGTYSEASGTAYLSGNHKRDKMFMLNGEIYIQMLGDKGYEGLQYYKLNSDNSAWEIAIDFSTIATDYTTDITYYINGSPEQIFQGQGTSVGPAVRSDGTFDLTIFTPGTLSFENLQTPTINNFNRDEKWYFYKYICNDKNQIAFFFSIGNRPSASSPPPCKCVLEAMGGSPVLYSIFKEDDIIE